MVTWSTLVEGDEQQDWPSQQATQVDEDKWFLFNFGLCASVLKLIYNG